MEGRICDIDGSGHNAVELILILYFTEVDIFGLGCAKIIAVIGLEVDNAVLELDELVGACAHGLCGLCTNHAQVALRESELVVVVIVLCLVAIVVKRRNSSCQLIDERRVNLGCYDTHGVIAGLLDTGDVGSGLACLHADCVLGIAGHQIFDRGTGCFCADHFQNVACIAVCDHLVEGFRCCDGIVKFKAPVFKTCCYRIAFRVQASCNAVVTDFLDEGLFTGIELGPELVLLLLGPESEISIVLARCIDEVEECVHTGTILLHTLDGLGEKCGGSVISGIAYHVHREDDIVDRDGLSIGEYQIISEGEIIEYGSVLVLCHFQIRRSVIGIIRSIVRNGLAFNALIYDCAHTVAGQQRKLCQCLYVLIIGRLRKER